ncbi:WD40 repeat-containing protein [Trypanosoma theileri]|uniref:WD40 repeat-containing protein n=1 Tax=Trypanosoma theileri TaxID=67003 RepID=A0A1X0P311_9TRYP|nr:WD40 repeat-containing protein [Trypanosoma theileri]ORC91083.1 WD40 repeat-containing protein [Trypanosoma theileri]
MSLSAAHDLYKECCESYGVKPNKDVMEQMAKPDFLMISEVDVSRTFLGDLGVRALLLLLSSLTGVRRLILRKNSLDAACIEDLCSLVRRNSSLSYLDLSENPLSTPSVRLLWDVARTVPTLREVKMEKCGVSEEWLQRVDRCCKANDELQRLGFYPYGPERSLREWRTVFVLVLGPSHLVRKYCADILPLVSSFVSKLRLRIAPLTIDEEDIDDVINNKVRRCKEMQNYLLSWCIALVSQTEKWHDVDRSALLDVLRQEEPIMPPLRSKLGGLRDPLYRCVKHLYVYDVTSLSAIGGYDKLDVKPTIPPNEWLMTTGIVTVNGVTTAPSAAVITSESSWNVRCQSDLYTALYTVFSERPRSMDTHLMEEEVDEELWEKIEKDKHIGALHPKCNDLIYYLESSSGSTSVPMILYGAGTLGKSRVLYWVASKYAGVDSVRVFPYCISPEKSNLVVFLYYLLRIFSKESKRLYYTVGELARAVREAICNYDGVMVLLLVSRVDILDGADGQESMVLEWLPASLPPTVRIIVTLNTESPLLPVLRKRLPQPYEVLITALPRNARAERFLEELARRGVAGLNMDTASGSNNDKSSRSRTINTTAATATTTTAASATGNISRSGSINGSNNARPVEIAKTLETAFLQKEGSEGISFAKFTASYLQRLPKELLEHDVAFLVAEEIPDTLEELLVKLLKRYEVLGNSLTVRYIMLSLTAAPLPISELLYICEELGPCTRHKTLPLLLMMSDDGLVTVTKDSIVYLSSPYVRQAVVSLYTEMQESISVLVETHLYRLIKTESSEMSFSFRHLGPLIMTNGNFDAANDLLLDTVIMDTLLQRDEKNCIYAIDYIFRLLNARDLFLELSQDCACSPMAESIRRLSRRDLHRALESLELYNGFLFQSSLLGSDASPYYRAAVEVTEVPYTVLVPLNRGDVDTSLNSLECKHPPIHCHLRKEYLAVTTAQEVEIYSTLDFQKAIARLSMPFELNQNLRGALIAAGTRVVVIGDEQLLLWDFAIHSFTLLEDTSASIFEKALDVFGVNLVVHHPSRNLISIINVSNKKIVSELPNIEAPLRDVFFFGNNILVLSLYELYIIIKSEVIKLVHSGAIHCVNFSSDGSLIASCVKNDIWVWSGTGELLHLIDAGLTPVDSVRFNGNGNLFLSLQTEGLKLWHSLSGNRIKELKPCMDERISYAYFSEDDAFIIGVCDSHISIWDSYTRDLVGALSCPAGHFTFMQERDRIIIAATSKNEVKVWRLADIPLSSVQATREKSITNMWSKSAKLSSAPITQLKVNSSQTLLGAVDDRGTLILQPLDGSEMLECNVIHVQSVAFLGDMILFSRKGDGKRIICKDFNKGLNVAEISLPRGTLLDGKLEIIVSSDEKSVAVIVNTEIHSSICVYDVSDWTLTNQFIGHSGVIMCAFFADEFLFSAGEDHTIRLWSLMRHAERTSYLHKCRIAAVAAGSSRTLFFMDDHLHLFHVRVEDIFSSTNARFVVNQIELMVTIPLAVKVKQAIFISGLFILSAENGSVYVVDLTQGGVVSRLADYKCLCLSSAIKGSDSFVMTGHSTGEVVLHRIRFAK